MNQGAFTQQLSVWLKVLLAATTRCECGSVLERGLSTELSLLLQAAFTQGSLLESSCLWLERVCLDRSPFTQSRLVQSGYVNYLTNLMFDSVACVVELWVMKGVLSKVMHVTYNALNVKTALRNETLIQTRTVLFSYLLVQEFSLRKVGWCVRSASSKACVDR